MTALAVNIIEQVKALGGRVDLLPPDKLKIFAPRNLVEQVKAHKPEILHYLTAHPVPIYQDDTRADFEERAAFIQYGTGLPREWAEAYAALCGNQGTLCTDIHAQAVDDGGRFLDGWGKQAVALGWKPEWVFSNTPLMAGLVFTIMGGDVLAIADTTAKLRMMNGTIITCCLTRRDVQKFGCYWEVVGYG